MDINSLVNEVTLSTNDREETLIDILKREDHFTYMHSVRVSEYAKCFIKILQLSEEDAAQYTTICQLHDIGKLLIPKKVLYKKDKLIPEEKVLILEHPYNGKRIINRVGIINKFDYIVLNHHERFDGKGYPEQKRGYNIPILCQVTSICDCIDAMTSLRTYQGMKPIEIALKEICASEKIQFSEEVINLLYNVQHRIVEKYEYFYTMNTLWK